MVGFGNRSREKSWGGGTAFSFESKKDPRFKGAGSASGMMSAEAEITLAIEALEKLYGVTAPDDIETFAMKE